MESLAPYLDELKRLKNLESDAAIARWLGTSKQHVHRIRNGESMGDKKCFLLAKTLHASPLELLSLNYALRADNKEMEEFWLSVHREARKSREAARSDKISENLLI